MTGPTPCPLLNDPQIQVGLKFNSGSVVANVILECLVETTFY